MGAIYTLRAGIQRVRPAARAGEGRHGGARAGRTAQAGLAAEGAAGLFAGLSQRGRAACSWPARTSRCTWLFAGLSQRGRAALAGGG